LKKPRPVDIINEIKMVGINGTEDYRRKNYLGLYPAKKKEPTQISESGPIYNQNSD
jgi:hypothetical protein